jgi:hypothetical protein
MVIDVQQMSIEEKLRTMEILWDDLCRNAPGSLSPAWHKNVLEVREKRVQAGEEKVLDWESAKKEIEKSIS